MVKHMIIWTLKEEFSAEEKETIKAGVKEGLEGLVGKVPGLLDATVHINGLPSSAGDMMLDSTFDCVESLKGYKNHPAHVEVANSKVRPFTGVRSCLDFEI